MRTETLGICAFSVAVGTGSPLPAADIVWSSDAALSKVTVTVEYLLVSKGKATIPIESGTIVTTQASATPAIVDLRLASAALTTGDPKRDAELRSEHFFDVARYPTIGFSSDEIAETNTGTFSVKGTLTMHGASHPILLDARSIAERRGENGKRHARFEATGSFRRSDFGMNYARGLVANAVRLDVIIEATSP